MTGTDQVYLGIDWSGVTPAFRLAPVGSSEPARLVPVEGPMRFRTAEPPVRYCGGWFDLSGPQGRHVLCDGWRRLETGRQCDRCRQREGFVVAHQSYDAPASQLPENLREYLGRPHRLYVDVFADGTVKVGTVAECRLHARLAEQGPVAAYYVASAADGLVVRRLEAAVSRRFGLPQSVSATRKLRGLTGRVDTHVLQASAREVATDVAGCVAELAGRGSGVAAIDPPEPWRVPPIAAAVFAATPLAMYPDPLTSGEHSLYFHGLAGSIGLFSVVADDDADRYVANLDQLYGTAVLFGDYRSRVGSVQPALF